jgi:hypothetical protein
MRIFRDMPLNHIVRSLKNQFVSPVSINSLSKRLDILIYVCKKFRQNEGYQYCF